MSEKTFEDLFAPVVVPDKLRNEAVRRGWSPQLLHRAADLRMPWSNVERWLADKRSEEQVRRFLDRREQVVSGTLRLRVALLEDGAQLEELFANSPEEIGDWLVTVERSPYPWAQFRLQENSYLLVAEERGIIVGARASSSRNTIVDGNEVSVSFRSAARVRLEARGRGYSQMGDLPIGQWYEWGHYYYLRSGNVGSLAWLQHLVPNAADLKTEKEGQMPGIPVWVDCFPARHAPRAAAHIRKATSHDLCRCVSLINRTHRGLDLFRPYTMEFLSGRLGDPYWGPKPAWWAKVYGRDDFYVAERDGRVVACGGLWDQGRHVREVWQHAGSSDHRVVESTCLMDWGFERGCEPEMASLIEEFIAQTARLGRAQLKAPLQFAPGVRALLAEHGGNPEERTLIWYVPDADQSIIDQSVKRPYTDLAYW
jgi:hypothetical protein